jgi:predicted permease
LGFSSLPRESLGWKLPLPLERTVSTLGGAAIPGLLVLMGIQLQQARWDGHTLALGLTSSMRLLAGPIISLGLAALFGLKGASYQAGISESAMPTAIAITVLATEYDIEPSFVTTAVFVTTVLSPLTLTPLLAFLGA